jgi:hypothetical protein
MVFHRDGWAALKGLCHDSSAWSRYGTALSIALKQTLPSELRGFSTEPAFRWDETSFAFFHTAGAPGWNRANDLAGYSADDAGEAPLLAHVVGTPSDYTTFATDYYEVQVDERVVADVFTLQPITAAMVSALNHPHR